MHTGETAAWVKWAAWLEREIKKGAIINEYDAGEALTKFRAVYPEFRGIAYTNISATSFGIRIESFLQIVESEFPGFYKFDRITRVPIDLRLVEWSLLSPDQKIWLKDHNRSVLQDLKDLLQDDDTALDYVSAMQVTPAVMQ